MTEPVNVKKLLGNRIKEIRKERKITQEKLAELIDIEPKLKTEKITLRLKIWQKSHRH